MWNWNSEDDFPFSAFLKLILGVNDKKDSEHKENFSFLERGKYICSPKAEYGYPSYSDNLGLLELHTLNQQLNCNYFRTHSFIPTQSTSMGSYTAVPRKKFTCFPMSSNAHSFLPTVLFFILFNTMEKDSKRPQE